MGQIEFIEKACVIHGDKYDYSKTKYVKSSQKVIIICPKHGEFEMRPNDHLKGNGCSRCNKEYRLERKRIKFIENAINIHGNRYDYSKVDFNNVQGADKVCIICRQHGEFYQDYSQHISERQNCPKCSAISGGRKRSGDKNSMKREDVKKKAQDTCLYKYGAKTWSMSDEGRKIQRDIVVNSDMLDRMKRTCMERYGTKHWTQSKEGHDKLSEIMSSDKMKAQVRQGYLDNYGVEHYMKTDEGRQKAHDYMSDDRQQKIANAMLSKYGVRWAAQVPGIARAGWRTKREDGTYNHSNPESTLYLLLCDTFGSDDVFWEYAADARYPFSCDFYIKSLDLFIELNAHWTHGGHWFDETDANDLKTLQEWKDKHSHYYDGAIYTWTVRDCLKHQTAMQNGLNYLVFWDSNLEDSKQWLKQFR